MQALRYQVGKVVQKGTCRFGKGFLDFIKKKLKIVQDKEAFLQTACYGIIAAKES